MKVGDLVQLINGDKVYIGIILKIMCYEPYYEESALVYWLNQDLGTSYWRLTELEVINEDK